MKFGIYRHYRGGRYRAMFVAHNSTNGGREGERLVIYISLTTGRINARNWAEFHGNVVIASVEVPRFEFTGEE